MTGPLARSPSLLEGADALARDPSSAGQWMAAIAQNGPQAHITNLRSHPMLVRHGDIVLPVLREDGATGDTYVASPHSAYVLYARDEIDIMGLKGAQRWGSHAALSVLDRWLKAARINRVVHLDNWLLSTSLHGAWNGEGLPAMRQALVERFDDHIPVVRCVDEWSCPQLMKALRGDGWTLLASRQIWVTDDLARDWKPRSHVKSDRRAMRRSGLTIETLETVTLKDAQRIADLYAQLYLGRYSSLNPVYTPAFVELAARTGLLQYRVARDDQGMIMAVAGMRVAGDIVTVPMLGYDTTRPQSEALYRIASLLSSEWALEQGLRHHGSAGAGTFKSNRGARSEIEYMALYTGHLAPSRRALLKGFAQATQRVMAPTLKAQGW
ncbi:MAG: hypothetical protein AAF127_16040 [Pseudomonadota bacterium]